MTQYCGQVSPAPSHLIIFFFFLALVEVLDMQIIIVEKFRSSSVLRLCA